MTKTLRGISSMATRQVLAELAAAWRGESGIAVEIESVGGVDAAKRVEAGEAFDFVVLAADAIDKLKTAERVVGERFDIVRSGVAVAVKAGEAHPDISSEEAVKNAVKAAPSIGYSTGPSGVALTKLFERWGIADDIKDRIVRAKPGVPVGSLVARGDVALGFQQLSELLNLDGIDLVGPLPDAIQITTTFSGGVCAASNEGDAVRAMFAFMTSGRASLAKRRQGMDPA